MVVLGDLTPDLDFQSRARCGPGPFTAVSRSKVRRFKSCIGNTDGRTDGRTNRRTDTSDRFTVSANAVGKNVNGTG